MTKSARPPERDRVHVVRRCGGARLYDTAALAYVQAPQLRALVRAGQSVIVTDATTGADVTAESLLGK